MAKLAVGQVLVGRVERLVDYAAFVSLGEGFDGFLHFSNAACNFAAARQLLPPGTQVQVSVKSIDAKSNRVGLSLVQVIG